MIIATPFLFNTLMNGMNGTYNFPLVRRMAREIANNIGFDKLYTEENRTYSNAPRCHLFDLIENLAQFVVTMYREAEPKTTLLLIERDLGDGLCGMYVNVDHDHFVITNSTLNVCKRRFTKIKELCSMYVNHYDTQQRLKRYDDYLASLKNAMGEKQKLLTEKLDDGDMDSETFSILLAIELMIPIHQRDRVEELLADIKNDKLSYYDIAKALLMPEFILTTYVEKNKILKVCSVRLVKGRLHKKGYPFLSSPFE